MLAVENTRLRYSMSWFQPFQSNKEEKVGQHGAKGQRLGPQSGLAAEWTFGLATWGTAKVVELLTGVFVRRRASIASEIGTCDKVADGENADFC